MRDDDIDSELDEFFSILLGAIAPPVGIAKLDLDVLAFRVVEGVQTAPESVSERMRGDADTSTPIPGKANRGRITRQDDEEGQTPL